MKQWIAGFAAFFMLAGTAAAEDTRIAVRALTVDAKFIGSGMSGMNVVIEDADTGEILDTGVTRGKTGNTDRILRTPTPRYGRLSEEGDAVYVSTLDIDRPRRVRVTVSGPNAQPQTGAEASSTRWVLPGKHLDSGDGWLIRVPGFAVDILAPAAHSYVENDPQVMTIRANVVMICGCPTSPGGTWDSDAIEITAEVRHNDTPRPPQTLTFTGQTSQYAVDVSTAEKGTYEILVTAFDPRTGNSGVDRTSFILR
ncbi:MAG: hypothetical protein AAF067_07550 [Pseudomonadota bacterium]